MDDAMEEAAWSADTYRCPFVMSYEQGKFVVFEKSKLAREVVLEIFNPVAPAVRCRNCGFIDPRGADTSIIQGS